MMIKLVVVMVVWVSLANADRTLLKVPKPVGAKIKAAMAKCTGPHDPSPGELIDIIRAGKYYQDENFRKLIYCTYRQSGFSKEDGRMDIETTSSVYPGNEDLVKVLKECDIVGPTPVETTFLSFKCFQDKSPMVYDIQN